MFALYIISNIALGGLAGLLVYWAYRVAAAKWNEKLQDDKDIRCKTESSVIVPFVLLGVGAVVVTLLSFHLPVWDWLKYVLAVLAAITVAFFGGLAVSGWVNSEMCLACRRYVRFRMEREIDGEATEGSHSSESSVEHHSEMVRRCVLCGIKEEDD
jgi:hypothetical protein